MQHEQRFAGLVAGVQRVPAALGEHVLEGPFSLASVALPERGPVDEHAGGDLVGGRSRGEIPHVGCGGRPRCDGRVEPGRGLDQLGELLLCAAGPEPVRRVALLGHVGEVDHPDVDVG